MDARVPHLPTSMQGNSSKIRNQKFVAFPEYSTFFLHGYKKTAIGDSYQIMGRWNKIIRLFVMLWVGLVPTGCGLIDTIKARQAAREGNSLYNESDYRGAIDKYKTAIELDPETPNIYLNLGYSYFSIYDPTAESEQSKNAAAFAVDAFVEHLKRHTEREEAVWETQIITAQKQTVYIKAGATKKEAFTRRSRYYNARTYLRYALAEQNPALCSLLGLYALSLHEGKDAWYISFTRLEDTDQVIEEMP